MSGRSACHGVRTRLLEGADLAGIRETERAHLEGCAACRAALRRVEHSIAALAGELDAIGPNLSADEAVVLATGAAGATGRRGRSGSGARGAAGVDGRRSIRRRLAWAAGPAVALIAAILGIVWAGPWPRGDRVQPPSEAPLAGARTAAAAGAGDFSVEAPETGGMAVFATRDPAIHVVWFYEDRDSDTEDRQGER